MKTTKSKSEKSIVIDIVIFMLIISIMLIFLVLRKNNDNQQPINRMQAIGYSVGDKEDILQITTETSLNNLEDNKSVITQDITMVTTVEETSILETEPLITSIVTEPLNETVIDYSNITRASLPSAYCEDVANLKNSNPDTRGWISLSNTNISYAFTQGLDNSYYLDHDFYGNESSSGWVFMDCMGSFDDNGQQSDIITFYGHNMANGTMFSTLKKYRDNPDFYQANPIITISSVNGYKYYKIFAYMVCYGLDGSDFEFWKFSDLSNPDDFYYYVNSAFNKSKIITGVDVQYGDKLIALSTCNSGSSTNHDRFVVLARMVRDGEDIYEGCYRIR